MPPKTDKKTAPSERKLAATERHTGNAMQLAESVGGELFDKQAVAAFWRRTVRTLDRWLVNGKHPPPDFKQGNSQYWRGSTIRSHLEAQRRQSGGDR